jgi:hypothetical protein
MGRLIDADKLEYTCNSDECGMLTGCNHCQYHIVTEDEIDSVPTVEAIPKADYEARLKADMVAMLTDIQLEIEEIVKEEELIDKNWANGLHYSEKIIQQKIDALRETSFKAL